MQLDPVRRHAQLAAQPVEEAHTDKCRLGGANLRLECLLTWAAEVLVAAGATPVLLIDEAACGASVCPTVVNVACRGCTSFVNTASRATLTSLRKGL